MTQPNKMTGIENRLLIIDDEPGCGSTFTLEISCEV